ncbi:putative Surp module [Monocercomonoides exilis]|uniref:putative Surp module n=1 Tax=Monocercomonoides exilis TaxID=2049356 RepID=UPI003559E193|nr:putative Surp module [Monocercomonoides exilis]
MKEGIFSLNQNKNAIFPTAPLENVDLEHVIEKMAMYVVVKGKGFETKMREEKKQFPLFSFLREGGEGNEYYKWRVFCALNGISEEESDKRVIRYAQGKRWDVPDTPSSISTSNSSSSPSSRPRVPPRVSMKSQSSSAITHSAASSASSSQIAKEAAAAKHPLQTSQSFSYISSSQLSRGNNSTQAQSPLHETVKQPSPSVSPSPSHSPSPSSSPSSSPSQSSPSPSPLLQSAQPQLQPSSSYSSSSSPLPSSSFFSS